MRLLGFAAWRFRDSYFISVGSLFDLDQGRETMRPLYRDPHFTFRFADDRLIPRFHLTNIQIGRQVEVFRIDPGTLERLCLLAAAIVGEGGWVDLEEPIIVRAGEAFFAEPDEPAM